MFYWADDAFSFISHKSLKFLRWDAFPQNSGGDGVLHNRSCLEMSLSGCQIYHNRERFTEIVQWHKLDYSSFFQSVTILLLETVWH